ncbi:hypothetical protein CH92_08980 [Stutzerimonas stutzeri]|uniref:Uncharacterized protein n=1 Tax=Stutzerimonas stutzeri TaxID=316 RepID=W8R4R5_STUST|nr:hypothetical protein CH92_08980 [Stutzerimonas stutzeri]
MGELGIGQSLAVHRALRVLLPNKRSNRANPASDGGRPLWYRLSRPVDSNWLLAPYRLACYQAERFDG